MTDALLRVFDAHFHIIDSAFPLTANHGYLPGDYSCDDYLSRMQRYDLVGGAVVSGSFQGFDQGYLLAALARLAEPTDSQEADRVGRDDF